MTKHLGPPLFRMHDEKTDRKTLPKKSSHRQNVARKIEPAKQNENSAMISMCPRSSVG